MKVIIVLLYYLFLWHFPHTLYAQNNSRKEVPIKPLRIGFKTGFPNLIGGNIEYVSPFINEKLAFQIDYSKINSNWFLNEEQEEDYLNSEALGFSYLELGLSYYLFKSGKGLYGGLSYGVIQLDATEITTEYTEYVDESYKSLNLKLGAKLGGTFYFRPEIGFSFTPPSKTYEVLRIYKNNERERIIEKFDVDGTSAEYLFQGIMATIGFGFAF